MEINDPICQPLSRITDASIKTCIETFGYFDPKVFGRNSRSDKPHLVFGISRPKFVGRSSRSANFYPAPKMHIVVRAKGYSCLNLFSRNPCLPDFILYQSCIYQNMCWIFWKPRSTIVWQKFLICRLSYKKLHMLKTCSETFGNSRSKTISPKFSHAKTHPSPELHISNHDWKTKMFLEILDPNMFGRNSQSANTWTSYQTCLR